MKKFVIFAMLLVSILTFSEVLDPLVEDMGPLSIGPWSYHWNPAGLYEVKSDSLLIGFSYKASETSYLSGLEITLVQPPEYGFAGALVLRRYLTEDLSRLSLGYFVSGFASVKYGLGLEVEWFKGKEDFLSILLDFGVQGALTKEMGYSFIIRNFRLWSQEESYYPSGDIGGSISFGGENIKIGGGATLQSGDLIKVFGNVLLKQKNLSIDLTTGYLTSLESKDYSWLFQGGIGLKLNGFKIGVGGYGLSNPLAFKDPLNDLSYSFGTFVHAEVSW